MLARRVGRVGATLLRCPAPCRYSTTQSTERVRRFYKEAGFAAAEDGKAFVVTLDGRVLKTPEATEVLMPTEAAAAAIAAEWESQESHIMPHLMPLTRLAMTALDVVPKSRESIIDGLMPYLDTDTVWYWEDPERTTMSSELHELQTTTLTPIIDWLEERFGARPETTTGLFVNQPEELVGAVREWVEGLDAWHLAALDQSVRALKSMSLAAALLEYRLSPDEVASASRLEETHQIEEWYATQSPQPPRTRHAQLLSRMRKPSPRPKTFCVTCRAWGQGLHGGRRRGGGVRRLAARGRGLCGGPDAARQARA